MNKKTKLFIIVSLSLAGLIISHYALAAGLVPCGGPGEHPCTLCDFFVLLNNIVDFLLFKLVPPIALLLLIIGGAMFLVSTGNPNTVSQGRAIVTSVVIGLVIIYGAYFFIGLILQSIGLSRWTRDIYHNWWDKGIFEIQCNVNSTPSSSNSSGNGGSGKLPPVISPGDYKTKEDCEGAGYYWYNNACHKNKPTISAEEKCKQACALTSSGWCIKNSNNYVCQGNDIYHCECKIVSKGWGYTCGLDRIKYIKTCNPANGEYCKDGYNKCQKGPSSSSSLQLPINQSVVKSVPVSKTFSSDSTIMQF